MKRYTAGIASDDLYNEHTSSVLKHNHLSPRAELRVLLVCCRQAMGSQLSKRRFESKQYRCINIPLHQSGRRCFFVFAKRGLLHTYSSV